MNVKLNTRQAADVTVVEVSGRITLGEGANALRDAITTLAANGHQKILLKLADASYIDSSGLGVLVAAFASLTNQGGQLKMLDVMPRVKDLLLITKLYTVFDVFDDEATALRSFAPVTAEPAVSGQ